MTIKQTYQTKINEKIEFVNNMHKQSDWTEEMERQEEKMNNQISWMQDRIYEIEKYDGSKDIISSNYR